MTDYCELPVVGQVTKLALGSPYLIVCRFPISWAGRQQSRTACHSTLRQRSRLDDKEARNRFYPVRRTIPQSSEEAKEGNT